MRAYTNLPRSVTGAIPVLAAECVATSIKLSPIFFIIGNRLDFPRSCLHGGIWMHGYVIKLILKRSIKRGGFQN